jgi:hypothetical protein
MACRQRSSNPRSRGLNVPAVFLSEGHGIPRGVEAQSVTDQPVIGLDTSELDDLLLIYPQLDQCYLCKQGQHHRRRWGCCQAFVAWNLLVMRV